MSEKTRLVKNTGLIAIGNGGARIVSFLLLPLYTSILSSEEYGTYDYIVAVSAFLTPVITMCITEAMFRFIIDKENDKNELRRIITNTLIVILIGMLVLAIGLIIVNLVITIEYAEYIWLYVTSSMFYSFTNCVLRGNGQIKEYAIISSGKSISTVILNVLFIVVFGFGMKGLLCSLYIAELLAFIIASVVIKLWKYIDLKLFSYKQVKEMIRYSLPLIPNQLCGNIMNLSDRIIVSNVLGISFNGIYAISYKFPNIVETICHFFYTAWSESASRILKNGKEEAVKYYSEIYQQLDRMVFSVILLMTAGMPILFRIFVRGDYVEGFAYIPLLMFAMYFDCIAKVYSGIFTAFKKTKAIATSTMWAALVNIGVNVMLIKQIGLYAAALSTLIANVVLVVMRKRLIENDFKVNMKVTYIIQKIVMVIIVGALYSYDSWLRIIISIVAAFVYALWCNREIIQKVLVKIKGK